MADTPEQHRARMARKKAVVDAGIAQATIERGVV
ncbi:MAG TPA: cob(I)yrinic acid a,c-diamide adenosyltransferase, partial [Gallionellaceae bacterium]|nr:cob(I)yrinic acid a,c-diamide adenosyltransferase [Gallionellaceae bacterium]